MDLQLGALIDLLREVKISTIATTVAGGVIGSLLTSLRERRAKARRQKAHWYALSAEVELSREMAQTFLTDGIMSPLYRLSTLAYTSSFPHLLADGAARTDQDTRAVTAFYNQVESLNRGLDQAHEALAINPTPAFGINPKLEQEYARNRQKAEDLVGRYHRDVRQVIDRHIGKT